MDLEVEILDIYIFALFTQIKILHNVIFLTKMDLKVKILDIFIFCSFPPYESVYTVWRRYIRRLETALLHYPSWQIFAGVHTVTGGGSTFRATWNMRYREANSDSFIAIDVYRGVFSHNNVDRDTTTDTDNTTNNFFAYFVIAKLKYWIFNLWTRSSTRYCPLHRGYPNPSLLLLTHIHVRYGSM
jgi:hypothetical protein